eukprot:1024531-Alexandrium_andersonii.AAC.1
MHPSGAVSPHTAFREACKASRSTPLTSLREPPSGARGELVKGGAGGEMHELVERPPMDN